MEDSKVMYTSTNLQVCDPVLFHSKLAGAGKLPETELMLFWGEIMELVVHKEQCIQNSLPGKGGRRHKKEIT